jgi:hypothetical protein
MHGSATATEAVRRAIQNSRESLGGLAKRYGINQKPPPSGRSELRFPIFPRPQRCEVDSLIYRGGSCRRRLSPAYAVAFGRLLVRATADSPAPDPIFIASLPATPFRGCRMWKAIRESKASSRLIRSAIFTSTLLRTRPLRAGSTFMLPSIARANLPSLSW